MPIPFTCPYCGHHTDVSEQYAGQTGPCVLCGQDITVPEVVHDSPPPATPPQRAPGKTGCLIVGLCLMAVVFGLGLTGLLIPAFTQAKDAAQEAACRSNLKQLGVAMMIYANEYGVLPRADGTPVGEAHPNAGSPPPQHSWRVAILPLIADGAHIPFRRDEPWDSEHNLTVAAQYMPEVYRCPSAEPSFKIIKGHKIARASYVMITGPHATGEGISLGDISDLASETLLLVEVTGDDRPAWCEPVDIALDDLKTGRRLPGSSHAHGSVNAVFSDGSVRALEPPLDLQAIHALGTYDGGESGVLFKQPRGFDVPEQPAPIPSDPVLRN